MSKPATQIGMIGHGFMGRVHSNAWQQVSRFYSLPIVPVLQTVCGRSLPQAREFAGRWGWRSFVSDVKCLLDDPAIRLIDITVPNYLHAEVAIAAAEAGKAVACEKPLACSVSEARAMEEAVARAGVSSFVWFNYRRVPAVALAKRFVESGRIGRIFHVRGLYLQDWLIDPGAVASWRLRRDTAGGGALVDLASHTIDLIRHLTASEFNRVSATARTFTALRPLDEYRARSDRTSANEAVDVDDAIVAIADLSCGATASLEVTRCGAGHGNDQSIEINGSRGSLRFRVPEFSYLEFWDEQLPRSERGWRRISATGAGIPYAEAYWPTDHPIGYAESFINTAADILHALAGSAPSFSPDFHDGLRCQFVLNAIAASAAEERWVDIEEKLPT